MNTFYETFIRKDVFKHSEAYQEKIIKIYDTEEKWKNYISMVLDGYVNGKYSIHQVYIWLWNLIHDYEKQNGKIDIFSACCQHCKNLRYKEESKTYLCDVYITSSTGEKKIIRRTIPPTRMSNFVCDHYKGKEEK